ncbi:MAG: CocE/NonD family hydrolase, partial [Candidatus Hydrogenedentes bacterium]|nr:CocE/NonD family hydrolase [Candidatus Hydrogenedentota bacterium]
TASNKSSHILSVWKEHPSFDEYWKGFDSNARANLAKAPALHVGGWWDIFNQGTIDAFVARQHKGGDGARGKQRLVMGAWTHGGPMGEKAGELVMPKSWAFDLGGQSLQFLKHCLMGGPSEIADGPAVRYYTLGDVSDQAAPGNEWRTADDWPPFKTQEMAFYLAPDGLLAKDSAADAKPLTYTFDPANPCPTKGGSNLVLPAGPFDQREIAQRPDVLSFATEPLTEPIEITGRVKVRLFVSSDAPDTDFTAKLLDIYPDGRAMGMLDGIQRVKYRKGFEKPDPLAPGTVVELEIDLWSISLIVNKGHRIGLQVSSSNYPRFELNPNTGADFPTEGGEMRKAANTVYLDKERPSALLLPVRPETQ